MRRVIIIEDEEDNTRIPLVFRPGRRSYDGWYCPHCGKYVYSMEVHSCNQPWYVYNN